MAQSAKADIRKEFLARRNAMELSERRRCDALIRQRILGHSRWRNSSTILFYVSFGSEVETHTLLQEALRLKKRVIIPVHDAVSKETPLTRLQRFSDLGATHRGVLQIRPEHRRDFDPIGVDLALVPGIAFDRQGGRIGFGGGFFDRLLPKMTKAIRMGLAYSLQIAPASLPLETHDERMHLIVTEKELVEVSVLAR